jgi:hypothetical protein
VRCWTIFPFILMTLNGNRGLQEVVSATSVYRQGDLASEIHQNLRFILTMFRWEVRLREVVSAAPVYQDGDMSIEIPAFLWFVLTISQW